MDEVHNKLAGEQAAAVISARAAGDNAAYWTAMRKYWNIRMQASTKPHFDLFAKLADTCAKKAAAGAPMPKE